MSRVCPLKSPFSHPWFLFINNSFGIQTSTMRKVILFMHVSLDGFVCGPNDEMDWTTMNDDKIGEFLIPDLQRTVDTMLVGRVLYQGFEQFWPTVPENPKSRPELVEFAHWMADTPKVIFSNTLKEVKWKNSSLAKADPATTVHQMKKEPGGDMVIFGGASLAAHFAKNNLIDEYRIKLEPVVLGKGKSLYKDITDRVKLKLIKSKSFDSGVTGLYYEVVK
jgi:dihydrofolate reductase